MAYKILPYSFRKAKELEVVIKPSSNILKKIDVFKNGKKLASIGARGMNDYPTYLVDFLGVALTRSCKVLVSNTPKVASLTSAIMELS